MWFGISQLKKLTAFFIIMDEKPGWHERRRVFKAVPRDERETIPGRPDIPKHSEKIMFYSLIKYLSCLFIFTFFTFGVLIYPMIVIWVFVIYLSRRYIILWKAHKYSVLFLLGASCVAIILSAFISPFIRNFLATAGTELTRFIL